VSIRTQIPVLIQENAMKAHHLALLVLTALALLASRLPADGNTEKQQAIAEIKRLNGTLIGMLPDGVSFDNKGVTDDDLVHLQKLPDLTGVYLRNCKITDTGLEKLAGLTKLKFLYLGGTQVTDKGLEHLKGLASLKSLSLNDTQVTDAGLTHLTRLPALIVLEIKGTRVTDAGVNELKKTFPRLTVRK
jgi:hypothetical protein